MRNFGNYWTVPESDGRNFQIGISENAERNAAPAKIRKSIFQP
jgi:hypothetical protein